MWNSTTVLIFAFPMMLSIFLMCWLTTNVSFPEKYLLFFRAINTNVDKEKLSALFWVLLSSLNILWLEVDYGDFPLSSLEIFTVLYFRPKFIISFWPLCGVVCLRYFFLSLCVHVYRNAHTCLITPEHMMAVSSLSVSALVPWDKYLTEIKTYLFI